MSAAVVDRIKWGAERDKEGYVTYNVDWLVETTDSDDGPQVVSSATGLPAIGDDWVFGNDNDAWAFCEPTMTIRAHSDYEEGDPHTHWIVSQKFSNNPRKRCQTAGIENPLLEPVEMRGNTTTFTKEATQTKDGDPLVTTSWEEIKGSIVEVPDPGHMINLSWNVASINLAFYAQTHRQTPLNDATLWGMPARTVRFADWKWQRLLYGVCSYYYKLMLDFELKYDGFDPWIPNRGNMVLPDNVDPDDTDPDIPAITIKENPDRFIVNVDANGQPCPCWLDAKGRKVTNYNDILITQAELLGESNLLLLGVPSSLP